MKRFPRIVLLGAGVIAVIAAALCVGPTDLLDARKLWDLVTGATRTAELERAALVLWELRLPRVLLAAAAGVNLALAGLLLQSIFRNPLAEPYLLGLSSGGALGAVAALATGATATVWPALAGSLAVAAIVVLLCRKRIAA
ncbi:MAG: iron chelate uptake ABC transporter family permease subunit, partial [Chthoniobacterales bacterium]